jgi:hypothetical protein
MAAALLVACASPEPRSPTPVASERSSTAVEPVAPKLGAPSANQREAVATARSESDAPSFDGTIGIVDVPRPTAPAALLINVRSGQHPGFDRIVWEFEKGPVPGYHVEYIDKPVRDCGEGKTIPILGDAWLEVRLYPANAHTEEGQPTIPEREIKLELSVARELERTCDFEAVVTWVVGLARPNRYRVLELSDPPRLVVDIQH